MSLPSFMSRLHSFTLKSSTRLRSSDPSEISKRYGSISPVQGPASVPIVWYTVSPSTAKDEVAFTVTPVSSSAVPSSRKSTHWRAALLSYWTATYILPSVADLTAETASPFRADTWCASSSIILCVPSTEVRIKESPITRYNGICESVIHTVWLAWSQYTLP